MTRNMWDSLQQGIRNKNMALFVFFVGVAVMIGGSILSLEDWKTSYFGFQQLEQAFGVKVTTAPWVLVVIAVMPWLLQIAFLTLYSLDRDRKWALAAFFIVMIIDVATDIQYHSQNNLLPIADEQPTLPAGVGRWENVIVSSLLTLIFFTAGAELSFTTGVALTTTLFIGAVEQLAETRAGLKKAGRRASDIMREADRPPQQQNQKPKQENRQGNGQNRGNQGQQRERPPQANPFVMPGVPTVITDPDELEELLGRSPRRQ